MSKIAVIGAGNVGATCAFSLFVKSAADIVLLDKIDGLPEGKALDIAQSQSLWNSTVNIKGSTDFSELAGSDVVVITAGSPRKPGMTRAELLLTNATIMKSVMDEIINHAPDAVVIVVANPVDNLTYYALRYSGFDKKRLFGMSGTVDGTRLRYFASQKAGTLAQEIDARVIGPHSDAMIPLINSRGVLQYAPTEISNRTVNAGAEIVGYLKTGSAFYTPGTSAAALAEAVVKDSNYDTEACVLLEGELGLNDVCLGIPVKVGAGGIKEILANEVPEDKIDALAQCAEALSKDNRDLPI